MLGVHCYIGFFLVSGSRGYPLAVGHGLLIAVASPVVERGLQGTRASTAATPGLESTGSISCGARAYSAPWTNTYLPHWQADSLPPNHQGSSKRTLTFCFLNRTPWKKSVICKILSKLLDDDCGSEDKGGENNDILILILSYSRNQIVLVKHSAWPLDRACVNLMTL